MATDQWEIRLVRPEDNVVLAQSARGADRNEGSIRWNCFIRPRTRCNV